MNASKLLFVLLAMLLPALTQAIDTLSFTDAAEEKRFQKLTGELRCLVCQNESLADSQADLAKDLRHQVYDLMKSGKSDLQIKQYLTDRYSDFVLYNPPLKPGTWLLWFGPLAVLAGGALVLFVVVRRRIRLVPASATPAEEEDW